MKKNQDCLYVGRKVGLGKAFLKFVKTKVMTELFLKHSSPKHPDISTLTASWRKKNWGGKWGTRGAWANPRLVEVPTAIGDERLAHLPCCCSWEATSARNHIMRLGPTFQRLAVENGSRAQVRGMNSSMSTGSLIVPSAGSPNWCLQANWDPFYPLLNLAQPKVLAHQGFCSPLLITFRPHPQSSEVPKLPIL